MTDPIRLLTRGLALTLASLVSTATLASAQAPDFWFNQPNGSISLYGGWSMPRENSDIFDHVRQEMTIQRGDFNAPLIGVDVAFRLTDRFDAVVGVEGATATRNSCIRDPWDTDSCWPDLDEWPIEQWTELSWTRAAASGRFYLMDRGVTVGSHAWVPARWAPYVGGGAGVVWYTFEQWGDFIDYGTIDDPLGPEIITGTLRSTGSGATAHVLGGLEVGLTRRLVLRGEYRYNWGKAPVDSRDFRGFDDIDLAGHRATIGLGVRF
jgi:opacity protein-like surface antigen